MLELSGVKNETEERAASIQGSFEELGVLATAPYLLIASRDHGNSNHELEKSVGFII
jgi:hypothetical protein